MPRTHVALVSLWLLTGCAAKHPATPAHDAAVSSGSASDASHPAAQVSTPDAHVLDAALSGPAACVAAGGRCVLGGGACSSVGPQDCNPDRNPGGAFCCLDRACSETARRDDS